MNTLRLKINAFVLLIVFLFPGCSQDDGFSAEEEELYRGIVSYSSGIEVSRFPLVRSLDSRSELPIHFLDKSLIGQFDFETVIIILGNTPLDESTPTVDMVYRVLKGIELMEIHPQSVMVMTGGKTVGEISEAEMMGLIAWSRGVDPQRIVLEEHSRTTADNALFTSRILKNLSVEQAFVVSKKRHLEWAIPYFRSHAEFKDVEGIDCEVTFEEIVRQMEEYLLEHESSAIRERLGNIIKDVRGVD